MPADATQIIIPTAAKLWTAPKGTTAPTNTSTAMGTVAAAWTDAGLLAEDGIVFGVEKIVNEVYSFGVSSPVRTVVSRRIASITVGLQQLNTSNLKLLFDGGAVTVASGTAKYTPPSDRAVQELAAVLEINDGSDVIRLVAPVVSSRESVTWPFPNTGESVYPLTLTALGGADGVASWYPLFSDTTAFAAG